MKLHLTVSKKWFDMIASDIKKEEYREIKPYWMKRLLRYQDRNDRETWAIGGYFTKFNFKSVVFKNGYQSNTATCEVEFLGLHVDTPKLKWCDPLKFDDSVFVIKLGKIIFLSP